MQEHNLGRHDLTLCVCMYVPSGKCQTTIIRSVPLTNVFRLQYRIVYPTQFDLKKANFNKTHSKQQRSNCINI